MSSRLSANKTIAKCYPTKEDYVKFQFIAEHKERLSTAKVMERLMVKFLEENKEWLAENMKADQ